MDKPFANHFACDGIEARNRHDLPGILSHYAADFELSSPLIARFTDVKSGRMRGKAAIGDYWRRALAALPDHLHPHAPRSRSGSLPARRGAHCGKSFTMPAGAAGAF